MKTKKLIVIALTGAMLFSSALQVAPNSFGVVSEVQAASVKLSKTKATLSKGETLTLKVKGTKDKVTWKSSDKKVAAVSKKGVVTAKKEGKATITAKVGKKTLKCKISVVDLSLKKSDFDMDQEHSIGSKKYTNFVDMINENPDVGNIWGQKMRGLGSGDSQKKIEKKFGKSLMFTKDSEKYSGIFDMLTNIGLVADHIEVYTYEENDVEFYSAFIFDEDDTCILLFWTSSNDFLGKIEAE